MDNLHFLGEKILEKRYEIAQMVHTNRMNDLKEVKTSILQKKKLLN
ncbi:anti-sigma-factor antagonist [Priestia megaterium]|nr:anti-sigma-factor antagonist [Priestia megaterium]